MSERGEPLMPAGSMAEYHAIKALSAGFIFTLDSECPLKAWLASPWNPDRADDNAAHFDIGTAAHLAILEPHLVADRVVLHGFDDYRSVAAREARDGAYIAGKTPLKPAEWAVVEGMQKAIASHSAALTLFSDGRAEVTLTWAWEGMTCKARPDFLSADHSYVLDVKTANTVNPRAIARKALTEGWAVRAAWYMGGVKAVTGTLPDKYWFVVVEKDAPHLVEIFEMDDRALRYGDQVIMHALKRAEECFMTNKWPGYGAGEIMTLALPSWQLAEREAEFEP